MIIWLLYIFFVVGIPIIFCLLLYRLRKRIPYGHIIMPIIIGIIALRSVILSLMYMLIPVISDTSYELFKSCLVLLIQYFYYAILTVCFYIASYIIMGKDKKFIISTIIITVIIVVLIYFLGGIMFKERERPDELYLKMQEFNSNNNLVGLTKREVIQLLGKPRELDDDTDYMGLDYYTFNAGTIYEGIIWGDFNIFTTKHYYKYSVYFDETNKVEYTSLKEVST